MKPRIAVLGATKKFKETLRKASGGDGQIVTAIESAELLPPDITAVAGESKDAGALLRAASAVSSRHTALLILIAQAIDAREGIGLENAPRVAEVARRFGDALGLDAAECNRFERGALLHDIGKLQIPNNILLTRQLLNHEEWALLRKHAEFGAAFIESIEGLEDLTEIIGSHHEKVDGTGYPKGLEGDEIPYLARAMKLVDVFTAMTAPRHYRTSVAPDAEALSFIREHAGIHFDPALVEVFTNLELPAR